jgi:hypothetical protein
MYNDIEGCYDIIESECGEDTYDVIVGNYELTPHLRNWLQDKDDNDFSITEYSDDAERYYDHDVYILTHDKLEHIVRSGPDKVSQAVAPFIKQKRKAV